MFEKIGWQKATPKKMLLKDFGPEPFVVDIERATELNEAFRTALWTGKHLQLTLMEIEPGEDIGPEIHPFTDQFLRIEQGKGLARMGPTKENMNYERKVEPGYAIFVPAGYWHNLINVGRKPIKLYSIYAPPQHPKGTIHVTKADAQAAEEKHDR